MAEAIVKWSWPHRGAEAELKSLLLQASNHIVATEPNPGVMKLATIRMLSQYPAADLPWAFLDGNLTSKGFDYSYATALHGVEGDSSPGMPLAALGCMKNKEALEKFGPLIKKLVLARLVLLSTTVDLPTDATALVEQGFCDPVRVFVKFEPHNPKKIAEGRLRLISSVSLIDQLCERILYGKQNALEIAKWGEIPSKPGMGLDDNSLAKLHKKWLEFKEPHEADVSGWDFSVQSWELRWEADFRAELAGALGTEFHVALRARAHCEMWTLFMLSDGRLLAQGAPGKRCSGSYNTSSGNSRVRVLAGFLVGSRDIFAMGDDSVEDNSLDPEEVKARYLELGHVVKMYEPCREGFEFCSTRIREQDGVVQGEPQNWARMTYRLLYSTHDFEERLEQYAYEMRGHKDAKRLIAVAKELLKLNVRQEVRELQCARGVAQNYPIMPSKGEKKKKPKKAKSKAVVPVAIVKKKAKKKSKQKQGAGVSSVVRSMPVTIGSVQRQRGPQINSGKGITVRHSEFLDTIPGSEAYSTQGSNQIYNLNPGLITEFPWLGTLGGMFESYTFNKLVFEVVSSAATTERGNMYMATQLDVEDANFTGVQDLMGYRGAATSNIWKSLTHDCLLGGRPNLYIRTGSVPSGADPRLYDYGRFTLATEGCTTSSAIGKLYVHYEVTFYTPKVTLAGALNFWRGWTSAPFEIVNSSWINYFLSGIFTVTNSSTAPDDYVTLNPSGSARHLQFNYPGLYQVEWKATTTEANKTAGVGFAAEWIDGDGKEHNGISPLLTVDSKGVVVSGGDYGTSSYQFQIIPRYSVVDTKTSSSTDVGLDDDYVDYVAWTVQILVLAAGCVMELSSGTINYGAPGGGGTKPTILQSLFVATLNMAASGLSLSMLPKKMVLTDQAASSLLSRVGVADRDAVRKRIVLEGKPDRQVQDHQELSKDELSKLRALLTESKSRTERKTRRKSDDFTHVVKDEPPSAPSVVVRSRSQSKGPK